LFPYFCTIQFAFDNYAVVCLRKIEIAIGNAPAAINVKGGVFF
jgi:hypothetical protein